MDQFIFNTMIDVTLKDLQTIKQGVRETFSKYMTRWKGKASRMVNRLNEKDQINMIIKNLIPTYNSRLLYRLLILLRNCVIVELGLKMLSTMDNWKNESKPPIKKTYGGGVATSKALNPMNVSAIIPQQTLVYPSFTKKARQKFYDLGMILTQTYENLSSKGFIKPQ